MSSNERILFKILRESPKPLAIAAFWRFVQASAKEHQFRDGFVEWWLVEQDIVEMLDEWRRREGIPHDDEEEG